MSRYKTPSEWLPILLKRARERRDWTAEQLADAVASHGGSLTANAIAKIETNRRNVSIDEWILLAAAVNVPPPLLLIPLGVDETIRITSRSEIHPAIAYEWMAGEECLANTDRYVIDRGAWLAGARPAFMFSKLSRVERDTHSAWASLEAANYVGDEDRATVARGSYVDVLQEYHRVVESLITAGLRAPAMPAKYVEAMRAIGLEVDHLPVWIEENA